MKKSTVVIQCQCWLNSNVQQWFITLSVRWNSEGHKYNKASLSEKGTATVNRSHLTYFSVEHNHNWVRISNTLHLFLNFVMTCPLNTVVVMQDTLLLLICTFHSVLVHLISRYCMLAQVARPILVHQRKSLWHDCFTNPKKLGIWLNLTVRPAKATAGCDFFEVG